MAKKRKPPKAPKPPPVTIDTPLSHQQERFVEEYLIDRNGTAAYMRVFPECSRRAARACGSSWRHLPNVGAEIQAGIDAQRIRNNVSADDVIKELRRLAFSDIIDLFDPNTHQLRHPRHIPYDTRKAIASIKVQRTRHTKTKAKKTTTTVSDTILEYRLWSKPDAIGKYMAHLGLNQAIPPIEVLLSILPPELSAQLRIALRATGNDTVLPTTNGKH